MLDEVKYLYYRFLLPNGKSISESLSFWEGVFYISWGHRIKYYQRIGWNESDIECVVRVLREKAE